MNKKMDNGKDLKTITKIVMSNHNQCNIKDIEDVYKEIQK